MKTHLYTPDRCPSKHWNDGDDICADCGTDLNPSEPDYDELVRQTGWFLNRCEDGTFQVKDFHGDPDESGPFDTEAEALAWAKAHKPGDPDEA